MDIKNMLMLGLKLKREFTGKNNVVGVLVHRLDRGRSINFFPIEKRFASLR